MVRFVVFTISFGLLFSCSRDEPIMVPEPLPETPGTNGDNANGQNPDDPYSGDSPSEGPLPSEEDLPVPNDPNMPTTKAFFSEPHEAIGELASFYNRDTGLWPEGWKTSAFAIMALVDYMDRTKTLDFTWVLDNTFRKNTFVKANFEDNAAWGIAWVRAYDLTKEVRYLDAAKSLHDQLMTAAWDLGCGGGLYGKSDKTTKTSASNLFALRLAAMLFERSPMDQVYNDNAQKIWTWIASSPLMGTNHRLKSSMSATSCTVADTAPNTQNQGLIISALSAMIENNPDPNMMDEARTFAEESLKEFQDANGIIVEKNILDCKPCANEEALYKGIFIQSLISLNQVLKDEALSKVLSTNAAAAWSKSKGTGGMIGYKWQAASDGFDAARQTSGAILLNSQLTKALERNYAFNGDTRTTANCTANEVASKAFDASASTKWCGGMINGINHLSVDLGAQRMVKTVRILHAGAGGEARVLNTKDFELQISSNGTDFTDLATIRNNQSSITFTKVNGTGRYLRLRFTNPGADNIGRIYEMSIE